MPDTILSLGPAFPGTIAATAHGINRTAARRNDDPEKIHHAAQQFESLFISQILKSAHGDSEGWLGTGDDQAASSGMAIAEEQLAQALGARGGLGLAALVEKGLTKSTNATGR